MHDIFDVPFVIAHNDDSVTMIHTVSRPDIYRFGKELLNGILTALTVDNVL